MSIDRILWNRRPTNWVIDAHRGHEEQVEASPRDAALIEKAEHMFDQLEDGTLDLSDCADPAAFAKAFRATADHTHERKEDA